jgi:dTDP-4-amino-4,6-dideoxygalactose transaminase
VTLTANPATASGAVTGGAKQRIFLSPPDVTEAEELAVVRAIRSGWVAPAGPDLTAFEAEVAARVGVAHGVGLSSATAALHLGLLTLGVGPGDVVITSTMTFAATANAITYVGAEPYFIDALPGTGNLDPQLVAQALDELTAAGERVAAIVPVDLFGKAVDYTTLGTIAADYGVPILSDAAESLGATHSGRAAGSFGAASAVSFNGNKIMTTSGGGMLLTDDGELADRVRYYATQARQPVTHYEHVDIGYNYRLSNLLAALGRAQLARLDDMISRRHEVRDAYKALFAEIDGVEVFGTDGDDEVTGWSAADLSDALAGDDIESRPLWKPMHLQPVFAGARGRITGASERLFDRGLTLPSGSALTDADLDRIHGVIRTVARTGTR